MLEELTFGELINEVILVSWWILVLKSKNGQEMCVWVHYTVGTHEVAVEQCVIIFTLYY